MKITRQHYETMESAVSDYVSANQSLIEKLLRDNPVEYVAWRILYGIDKIDARRPEKWLSDEVYPYADDSHIEMALKRIISGLCVG